MQGAVSNFRGLFHLDWVCWMFCDNQFRMFYKQLAWQFDGRVTFGYHLYCNERQMIIFDRSNHWQLRKQRNQSPKALTVLRCSQIKAHWRGGPIAWVTVLIWLTHWRNFEAHKLVLEMPMLTATNLERKFGCSAHNQQANLGPGIHFDFNLFF